MTRRKLEISDEQKSKLEEMRKILAGISLDNEDISISKDGCGDHCRNSCSYYCEDHCAESCKDSANYNECAYKSVYVHISQK